MLIINSEINITNTVTLHLSIYWDNQTTVYMVNGARTVYICHQFPIWKYLQIEFYRQHHRSGLKQKLPFNLHPYTPFLSLNFAAQYLTPYCAAKIIQLIFGQYISAINFNHSAAIQTINVRLNGSETKSLLLQVEGSWTSRQP